MAKVTASEKFDEEKFEVEQRFSSAGRAIAQRLSAKERKKIADKVSDFEADLLVKAMGKVKKGRGMGRKI